MISVCVCVYGLHVVGADNGNSNGAGEFVDILEPSRPTACLMSSMTVMVAVIECVESVTDDLQMVCALTVSRCDSYLWLLAQLTFSVRSSGVGMPWSWL